MKLTKLTSPLVPGVAVWCLCCAMIVIGADSVSAAEPFEAFLKKHCVRCHGPQKEKGDIRIDQLSRDFKAGVDTHHWAEALDKVNSGEMPPEDEPQPTQDEIAAFVLNLNSRLKEGRAARMAARPAVAHYRLSRKEYQNTVYDLLGVRYDPAKPGELLPCGQCCARSCIPCHIQRGSQDSKNCRGLALPRREGRVGSAGPIRH